MAIVNSQDLKSIWFLFVNECLVNSFDLFALKIGPSLIESK